MSDKQNAIEITAIRLRVIDPKTSTPDEEVAVDFEIDGLWWHGTHLRLNTSTTTVIVDAGRLLMNHRLKKKPIREELSRDGRLPHARDETASFKP